MLEDLSPYEVTENRKIRDDEPMASVPDVAAIEISVGTGDFRFCLY
jgi:hypothetical protein